MVRNSKKLSLAVVVAKVKHIAEVQYDGKIYDNILPIFNQLTTIEKRVLLRGLIGFTSVIEEKILGEQVEVPAPKEEEVQLQHSESSVPSSDKVNWKKNWMSLGSVGVIIFVLFLTTGGSFFLTGENGLLAKIQHYIAVIKTAF